jgi:hypothetical protein
MPGYPAGLLIETFAVNAAAILVDADLSAPAAHALQRGDGTRIGIRDAHPHQ